MLASSHASHNKIRSKYRNSGVLKMQYDEDSMHILTICDCVIDSISCNWTSSIPTG